MTALYNRLNSYIIEPKRQVFFFNIKKLISSLVSAASHHNHNHNHNHNQLQPVSCAPKLLAISACKRKCQPNVIHVIHVIDSFVRSFVRYPLLSSEKLSKARQGKAGQGRVGQGRAGQSQCNQTKPNQTKPKQTMPNQAKPSQTKPSQAKPNYKAKQTKPDNQTDNIVPHQLQPSSPL